MLRSYLTVRTELCKYLCKCHFHTSALQHLLETYCMDNKLALSPQYTSGSTSESVYLELCNNRAEQKVFKTLIEGLNRV